VIANAKSAEQMTLSLKDIFLALAKDVPNPDGSETLVPNPYKTWNEVNPSLPKVKIEVLGPPPTSGTRDAFNELAIEGGCKTFPWLKAMKSEDKSKYKAICRAVREDGAYVEAGENDNLIIQKLEANTKAVGVFGYSFLDQNRDKVQGSIVDGVSPTFEAISSGEYPVSRSLYFYIKKAHVGVIPGIEGYVREFTSEKAFGEEGYLTEKGLIPSPKAERKAFAKAGKELAPMTGNEL
jgi:phosphate transport system substrate-binding protein